MKFLFIVKDYFLYNRRGATFSFWESEGEANDPVNRLRPNGAERRDEGF